MIGGAIGVAVGYSRLNIAIVLSVANLLNLWPLMPLAERITPSSSDSDAD
jgi:uncharacterized membrane protein YhiD involved in acid resistance